MIENGASEKTGGGGGYVQPSPINKSLAADRTERPTLSCPTGEEGFKDWK